MGLLENEQELVKRLTSILVLLGYGTDARPITTELLEVSAKVYTEAFQDALNFAMAEVDAKFKGLKV